MISDILGLVGVWERSQAAEPVPVVTRGEDPKPVGNQDHDLPVSSDDIKSTFLGWRIYRKSQLMRRHGEAWSIDWPELTKTDKQLNFEDKLCDVYVGRLYISATCDNFHPKLSVITLLSWPPFSDN